MSKLSVADYASKHQISTQAVYNKIKKGVVNSVAENGKTYVLDDEEEVDSSLKDDCNKIVNKLLKQNMKLTKKLLKEADKKERLIFSYVEEMKALYLPPAKDKKKKKKR